MHCIYGQKERPALLERPRQSYGIRLLKFVEVICSIIGVDVQYSITWANINNFTLLLNGCYLSWVFPCFPPHSVAF